MRQVLQFWSLRLSLYAFEAIQLGCCGCVLPVLERDRLGTRYKGLVASGDGVHDSHHPHGPAPLIHLVPPLLDVGSIGRVTLVLHTCPDACRAFVNHTAVFILSSTLDVLLPLTVR